MRLDFVKRFVDSTGELFQEVLGPKVDVQSIRMRAAPAAGSEVMAIIGLTGEAEGRVIFDMDLTTALQVAGQLMGEPARGLTPMVQSSIAELSSMAIGRAISRINDEGTGLRMSPPTVITGTNLLSFDQCFETLVVPMRTECGEVRLNVMMRDLD
jgi:chemotaxis protein CheX